MAVPVWLRWLLGAAMAAVAVYHLRRAYRRDGPGFRRPLPASDLWHAAMAACMGLMVFGVTGRGAGWWLLAFAVPAAVVAWRALDRYVVDGVMGAAHELRELVAGVAMCWMLAAPLLMTAPMAEAMPGAVTKPAGSSTVVEAARASVLAGGHVHGMGAMAAGPGSGVDPDMVGAVLRSVTAVLLVAVLALASRAAWMALRHRPAPARSGIAICPAREMRPASWQGCQLAMHVTAAVMLVAMV
jgi:hypothetical protein